MDIGPEDGPLIVEPIEDPFAKPVETPDDVPVEVPELEPV